MARIEIQTDIEIDDYELDKRVIEEAADRLLDQLDLTARYGGTVPDLIQEKLSEIVSERIEAMLDKPVIRVDRFGDQIPGTKTFRDTFADAAETFLEDRVDNHGRKASGFGSLSRLEYLIRQVGVSAMDHECRKVAKQFKDALNAKATAAITKVVAEQVKRAS